jgi:hypothetical protein
MLSTLLLEPTMERLCLPQSSTEPESEVHPVDGSFPDESLDFVIEKEKVFPTTSDMGLTGTTESEEKLGRGFSEAVSSQDDQSESYELGTQFTWSDEDFSEQDGVGFTIYDSIKAIRKEASKFNAVLAVDQLDSLKIEICSVKRELQDRTEQLEELQALVQLKDDRIGTLELERDLYKADTNKLANDLESCLVKLRRVGQVDKPDIDGESNVNITAASGIYETAPDVSPRSPLSVLEVEQVTAQCHEKAPRRTQFKTKLDPPSCAASTSRTSVTASIASRSAVARRTTPVFEKPRITAVMTPSQHADAAARNPAKIRTFCGQRNQVRPQATACSSKELEHSGFLQEQVQEISQRLMSALDTSEELRRRLAMLNRYYESTVSSLEDNLATSKADRFQLEFDLTRQIAALERENVRIRAKLESNGNPDNKTPPARGQRAVTFDV